MRSASRAVTAPSSDCPGALEPLLVDWLWPVVTITTVEASNAEVIIYVVYIYIVVKKQFVTYESLTEDGWLPPGNKRGLCDCIGWYCWEDRGEWLLNY